MAEQTGISWTDHTFNPWWGCTKIAAGCDNCYAAALDKRTGGNYWNGDKPRRTSNQNWAKVRAWDRKAKKLGVSTKVFCGSMCDWCDKNAPEGALDDLWQLIRETPNLEWQLLTKRATLIKKRLPADWGDGYPNVWIGVTVENKIEGFKRLDALRGIPAKLKFISAEPLLEELDNINLDGIDWIIIGGESGPNSRPMNPLWASKLIDQADDQGIPLWFKQIGGSTRDKGGDIINGETIKLYPRGH